MALSQPATPSSPSESDVVNTPDVFQTPINGNPDSPNPPKAPEQPVVPQSAPIVVGDRTFPTLADAQNFLNDQMKIASTVINANKGPTPTVPAEVQAADLVFEDPKTAFKLLEKQILDGIHQRSQAASEAQRIENDFYSKHEDLVAHKDFVKFKTTQLINTMPGFGELPADRVFEIVAAQTRSELAKIRGQSSNGQPLPDKPAVVAGGGGAVSPPAQAATPAKPMTFVDELKAARAKRAK